MVIAENCFRLWIEGEGSRVHAPICEFEFDIMAASAAEDVVEAELEQPSPALKLNRRLLKKKKQLCLKGKGNKGDYFDVYGVEAKAEAILQPPAPNSRLTFKDLQGLVRWVLADGESPKWVFIKNKPLVGKVVMLHLPGIDAALYMTHSNLFKGMTECLGFPRATVGVNPMATSSQTIEAIFSCPKIRTQKNQVKPSPVVLNVGEPRDVDSSSESDGEEEAVDETCLRFPDGGVKRRRLESGGDDVPGRGSHNLRSQQAFPASYYTLTTRQMYENGYPKVDTDVDVLACELPGYVKTRPFGGGGGDTQRKPLEMVAVDCEMCYTCEGLELTRVSIVDAQGKAVLDRLVKPTNPIVNYNTQYSGITAAMMKDVTTTLAEVQEEILGLISAETILVGHSVENDLIALKLLHPLVIDTALLYHHPTRGPMCKPALRMLSARFLRRKIQGNHMSGHDSVEDAKAAMDLAWLKIRNGPGFGKRMKPNCESLIDVLGRHKRRSTLIDRRSMLHQYAVGSCNAVIAASDDDVFAKAMKEVKKEAVDFVWAHFMELNTYYEDLARGVDDWSTRMAEMAALMTCNEFSKSWNLSSDASSTQDRQSTSKPPLPAQLQTILARLNDRVTKIHSALPPNSVLIVVTGHGDAASVRRIQELKWKRIQNKEAGAEKWSESNEAVLEELGARAQTTVSFTCIK